MLRMAVVLAALLLAAEALAGSDDVLFEADSVVYHGKAGYIEAIGQARFVWRDYIVSADRVRYFEAHNRIEAHGHVVLLYPNGSIIFAQQATLSNDWQDSTMVNVAIFFQDESRLTARSTNRRAAPKDLGLRNQMRHATYSPCRICPDKKNYPLWQISANKVSHYEKSKTIHYNNLFLEFFGIPVFYLPFFSHPDPSVKRRTGFLIPKLIYSNLTGVKISLPYTVNIAPQTSLVLTPTFTSKAGALLQVDWHHITKRGQYNLSSSLAHAYEKKPENWPKSFRGHVFSDGAFNLGQDVRLSYTTQWVSDDDYLDFFDLSNVTQLNSNIALSWSDAVISTAVENYFFQDLLPNNNNPDLLILPLAHFAAEPELFGGHAIIKASLLSLLRRRTQINQIIENEDLLKLSEEELSRLSEEDLLRLSGELGWQDQFIAPLGNVFRVYGSVRYDFYQRRGFRKDQDKREKEQTLTRVLPLVLLEWRWPFMLQSEHFTQIFEPIGQLIYTPYRNSKRFPDQDSQGFSFSDNNVLSSDRFFGLDRWESGPRANLGFQWTLYQSSSFSSSFLLGQVLRLKRSNDFSEASGLAGKYSDIVARWNLSFSFLQLLQSVRLDHKNGTIKRYDADFNMNYNGLSFFTGYALDNTGDKNQEIYSKLAQRVQDHFLIYGETRYNLSGGGLIGYQAGILYTDECFKMDLSVGRRETQNNRNEFRVGLRLSFKNLGAVQLSSGGTPMSEGGF